jgi:hypothetical protein
MSIVFGLLVTQRVGTCICEVSCSGGHLQKELVADRWISKAEILMASYPHLTIRFLIVSGV